MNLKGKLNTNLSLKGSQAIAGGSGGGGASNWNEISGKPFNTISDDDFIVLNGELQLKEIPITDIDWDEVDDKPFSSVDTEGGLKIYDNTLMLDTLDTIATQDYVDSAVAAITPTIPAVSASSTLATGTEIGTITIDGTTTTFYAPSDVEEEPINITAGFRVYFDLIQYYTELYGQKTFTDVDKIVEGSTLTVEYTYGGQTIQDTVSFKAKPFKWITSIDGQGQISTSIDCDYGYYCNELLPYSKTTELSPLPQKCLGYAFYENQNKMVGLAFFPISMDMSNVSSVRIYGNIERGGSEVSWDDITNKPSFATVATTGDYDDLSNKPTIPTVPTNVSSFTNDAGYITSSDLPQADGTTIVDNNGVWSAVGGGSEPDEKSIITNSQGKLEEAVPVYREQIPTSYCQMLINEQWTKGTSDWDIYITKTDATAGLSFDSSDYNYRLDLIFDLDGTNQFWYSGTWKPTTTTNNQWKCDSKSDNAPDNSLVGTTQQVYYTSTAQSQGYQYRFHAWLGSKLTSYNIVGISITALYSDDEYFTEQMLTAADLPHSSVVIPEIIYHKLPKDYIDLNIVSDEVLYNGYYPMLYNDNKDNIRAYRIGSGSGISISTMTLTDGTKGYQLNNTMKESPIGGYTNGDRGSSSLYLSNFEDISGGNPFKRRYYTNQNNWNSFFNNAGSDKDLVFTLGYCMSASYYNNGPKITGIIHLGASNTDQPIIEGFEEIIDTYYIDTTNTNKYFCIELKDGYNIGFTQNIMMLKPATYYPIKANINSFFLPLDNSTIVRDTTNGNIKTAIPAAPTTDGTYTLQATVSNGTITYSWI